MKPAITDRPKEFLVDQLEKLKLSSARLGVTCLFNDSNLDALFGVLDPSSQGFITYGQYKQGKCHDITEVVKAFVILGKPVP